MRGFPMDQLLDGSRFGLSKTPYYGAPERLRMAVKISILAGGLAFVMALCMAVGAIVSPVNAGGFAAMGLFAGIVSAGFFARAIHEA